MICFTKHKRLLSKIFCSQPASLISMPIRPLFYFLKNFGQPQPLTQLAAPVVYQHKFSLSATYTQASLTSVGSPEKKHKWISHCNRIRYKFLWRPPNTKDPVTAIPSYTLDIQNDWKRGYSYHQLSHTFSTAVPRHLNCSGPGQCLAVISMSAYVPLKA